MKNENRKKIVLVRKIKHYKLKLFLIAALVFGVLANITTILKINRFTNGNSGPSPAMYFVTKWGVQGTGDGQFQAPYGVAVNITGYVYVCDWGNHRIQIFTASGQFVAKWGANGGDGSSGTGNGEFYLPAGIAINSTGYVYVCEYGGQRIQVFTPSGAYLTQWGTAGAGDGYFAHPFGVAVNSSGYVYVADTENNRVQVFTSTGQFLNKWGSAGAGNGQFNGAYGIALNSTGYVYVVDVNNYRVQVFTATGGYVRQWGGSGSGNGQFNKPRYISLDEAECVLVTDSDSNHRVQKFTSTGAFITKWGSLGSTDGQFNLPMGIAINKDTGNIYVVEYGNRRVQVFNFANSPPLLTSPSDLSYQVGQTGKSISWIVTDTSVGTTSYTIYKNSSSVRSGSWNSGASIQIDVDGLPVGTYNYTLEVQDGLGGITSDEVHVTVNSSSSQNNPDETTGIGGYNVACLTVITVVSITITRRVKKAKILTH